MPTPEELARQNVNIPADLKDWSSSDKTLSAGSRVGEGVINVQHLQSSQLDKVSRVCISTIQRLYSMLGFSFFWIETLIAQREFTQRERRRAARDQRNAFFAPSTYVPHHFAC